jgi:hypothetical protein
MIIYDPLHALPYRVVHIEIDGVRTLVSTHKSMSAASKAFMRYLRKRRFFHDVATDGILVCTWDGVA